MSKTEEEKVAAGCMMMIGIFCVSVAAGYQFSPAFGWLVFGLMIFIAACL